MLNQDRAGGGGGSVHTWQSDCAVTRPGCPCFHSVTCPMGMHGFRLDEKCKFKIFIFKKKSQSIYAKPTFLLAGLSHLLVWGDGLAMGHKFINNRVTLGMDRIESDECDLQYTNSFAERMEAGVAYFWNCDGPAF